MSLGNLGDLGNLDLSTLQQYLPDVNFPASKEEVASNAESNNAPQELVQQIRSASTERFNSPEDRKSTRLNSSHANISYAVFCLKKKQDVCLMIVFARSYLGRL